MSSQIDMSLDAIIKSTKPIKGKGAAASKGGRGGGRGRGQTGGRGGGRGACVNSTTSFNIFILLWRELSAPSSVAPLHSL
jgi:hypothetical protein